MSCANASACRRRRTVSKARARLPMPMPLSASPGRRPQRQPTVRHGYRLYRLNEPAAEMGTSRSTMSSRVLKNGLGRR